MRYTRDIYDSIIHDKQTGKLFEEDVIGILSRRFCTDRYYKSRQCRIINCAGMDIDQKAGTDFIYKSIDCTELRIDLTLDFEEKKCMPYIVETDIPATDSKNFKMGIRHGNTHNGYTEFDKPVVVVGLEMSPQDYRIHEDEILDNIMSHYDDLICEAQSIYEAYTEKEYADDVDWKRNPNYKRPKNLGNRYAEIENVIENINKENINFQEGMTLV